MGSVLLGNWSPKEQFGKNYESESLVFISSSLTYMIAKGHLLSSFLGRFFVGVSVTLLVVTEVIFEWKLSVIFP